MNQNKKIFLALTLYLTSLFASNTLGLKLMPFIFGTHLSVSIFFFPFVYITTDCIGQVFGKKLSRDFVFMGFLSILVFLFYSIISEITPWSTDASWVQSAYDTVFGITFRVSVASLLAYIIGEYQDVLSFIFFKAKTGGKMFWLTSNIANIWSQFLDSYIFMLVAFVGIYSWHTIIFAGLAWWMYKVIISFFYTPLAYGYVYWLRKSDDSQTHQNQNI